MMINKFLGMQEYILESFYTIVNKFVDSHAYLK